MHPLARKPTCRPLGYNRGAAVQRRQPAEKFSTAWRLCRPSCLGVLSACLFGPGRPPFLGGKRQPESFPQLWHRPVKTAWGHPLISRFSRPFESLQRDVEPGIAARNPILVTRSPKRYMSRQTGLAPCFLPRMCRYCLATQPPFLPYGQVTPPLQLLYNM